MAVCRRCGIEHKFPKGTKQRLPDIHCERCGKLLNRKHRESDRQLCGECLELGGKR